MTWEKPREIAVRILSDPSGSYVETRLDRLLDSARLKPEDRRFLQELVYGAVRWQLTLDWLIEGKTAGRPQKTVVQNLLRLALYQMFWLDRVPSYAVVNETVEICKKFDLPAQAKFVNAVLRTFGREAEVTKAKLQMIRQKDLSIGYSHPSWLCERWTARFGSEAAVALLKWNNSSPPTFARVNTLRTSTETLLARWPAEGVEFEEFRADWFPPGRVFRLLKHPPLSGLPSFNDGGFYVQDPSTLLAVKLLDPQPGEEVLDVCAAPGGKTTYIADTMGNSGLVLAQDLVQERLEMVCTNAARLGVTSIQTAAAGDRQFDRVLVDAPCSNTGVMRRRVDLRWRIRPEEITRLTQTQLEILESAAARCRSGGILVYSTCSLEPEENGGVIKQFLQRQPAFRQEAERELTPMHEGTDGAYCARLIRIA